MKRVIVIGGGLGGLTAAAVLARQGIEVTLLEKRNYPFHRVCGEYISNEATPFLKSIGCFPSESDPPFINRFQLSSVNGRTTEFPLDQGGFGISRFTFDHFLAGKVRSFGGTIVEGAEVESVTFKNETFEIATTSMNLQAEVVIGTFGKRSKIDVLLDRDFLLQRSPYVGIKYHIRLHAPDNLIALHNFENGYCGISRVENGVTNLCYLTHQSNLKKHKTIHEMERAVLFRNPFLKTIFTSAEFLFSRPETISEISFESKEPVANHILMAGDAAGMITPLCGNGMAMAIHSGKIAAELACRFCKNDSYSRHHLERDYRKEWTQLFARRLWAGRQIQKLFGSVASSNFAVNLSQVAEPVARWLVTKTHGKPF